MPRTAVTSVQRQLLLRRFSKATGLIVELGVDWGVTTMILATRMPHREVLAIDSWDPKYHKMVMPDGEVSTAQDKYAAALALQAKYDNIEVVKADVVEYGQLFKGEVGSIFFDAAHEEEPILKEFAAWLPHVHEQGVAVVHDANKPGVARACDRVMEGHFFKHGMCIWDRRIGAKLKGT